MPIKRTEGLTNSEIREVKINLEAPNAVPEAQWCREILQQKLCVIILHKAQVLFHSGKFEFEGQLFKHCSLLGNHQYIFFCSISFLSIHFLLSHFDQVQKNLIVNMILHYNSHGQNCFYQFTTYKTRFKKQVQMWGESMSRVGTRRMVNLSRATTFVVAGSEGFQEGGEWEKRGNYC